MIALIGLLAGVLILLIAAFVYGTRGKPNQEPAIGNNRPWPDGLGPFGSAGDEPPYAPTAVIGDAEMERRRVDALFARRTRSRRSGSWMEEPGAFDRYGLVDEQAPNTDPPAAPSSALRKRKRRR